MYRYPLFSGGHFLRETGGSAVYLMDLIKNDEFYCRRIPERVYLTECAGSGNNSIRVTEIEYAG